MSLQLFNCFISIILSCHVSAVEYDFESAFFLISLITFLDFNITQPLFNSFSVWNLLYKVVQWLEYLWRVPLTVGSILIENGMGFFFRSTTPVFCLPFSLSLSLFGRRHISVGRERKRERERRRREIQEKSEKTIVNKLSWWLIGNVVW